MKEVALRVNVITFSTFFSEETQKIAGVFHAAAISITRRRSVLVSRLAHRLLTPDMAQSIAKIYTQFCQLLNSWLLRHEIPRLEERQFDCGEAPSV